MHPRWHVGMSAAIFLTLQSEAHSDENSDDLDRLSNNLTVSGLVSRDSLLSRTQLSTGEALGHISGVVKYGESYEKFKGGDVDDFAKTNFALGAKLITKAFFPESMLVNKATDAAIDAAVENVYYTYVEGPRRLEQYNARVEARDRAADQLLNDRRWERLGQAAAAINAMPKDLGMNCGSIPVMSSQSFSAMDLHGRAECFLEYRARKTLSNCDDTSSNNTVDDVNCKQDGQKPQIPDGKWNIVETIQFTGQGYSQQAVSGMGCSTIDDKLGMFNIPYGMPGPEQNCSVITEESDSTHIAQQVVCPFFQGTTNSFTGRSQEIYKFEVAGDTLRWSQSDDSFASSPIQMKQTFVWRRCD